MGLRPVVDTDVRIRVDGAAEGAAQVESLNEALNATQDSGRKAGAGLASTEQNARAMKSAMDSLSGQGGGYGKSGAVGGLRKALSDMRNELDAGFSSFRSLGRGIGAISQAFGVFGLAVQGVNTAIEIGGKVIDAYRYASSALSDEILRLRVELGLLGHTGADSAKAVEAAARRAAAAATRIAAGQDAAIGARASELGTIPELLTPQERAAAGFRAGTTMLRGADGANTAAANALSGGMFGVIAPDGGAPAAKARRSSGGAPRAERQPYYSGIFDDYLGMQSTLEAIASDMETRVRLKMARAQETADYEAQFNLPAGQDDADPLGIGRSVDAVGAAVDRLSPFTQAFATQMTSMADVSGTAAGMVVGAMTSMSQAVGTALTNLIVTGKAGEKGLLRVAGTVAVQTSAQAFSYATLLGAMAAAAGIIGIPIFGATAGQLGAGAGIMFGAGGLLAGVGRALGAQGIGFGGRGAAGGAGGGGISDAAPARRDPGLLGGPSVVNHNYNFGGAIVGADADRMVAQAAARGTVVSGPSRGGLRLQMAS